MRFSTAAIAALPVLAASALAQTNITVQVGAGGAVAYNPPSVNASVGDTISFVFMGGNHTVTQSTFAAPCSNMTTPAAGIDSGFQAVPANPQGFPSWSFTVNDTSAPLWFYCRHVGHCQMGMVFAVNPTAEKSFQAFQAAANASTPAGNASAPPAGSPSGGAAPPAGSSSGSPSATPNSAGTNPNGAMTHGVRAGGLLAVLGFAAGLLL